MAPRQTGIRVQIGGYFALGAGQRRSLSVIQSLTQHATGSPTMNSGSVYGLVFIRRTDHLLSCGPMASRAVDYESSYAAALTRFLARCFRVRRHVLDISAHIRQG
jgi:hypothetical protein